MKRKIEEKQPCFETCVCDDNPHYQFQPLLSDSEREVRGVHASGRESERERLLKNADKQVGSRDIESSETYFFFFFQFLPKICSFFQHFFGFVQHPRGFYRNRFYEDHF